MRDSSQYRSERDRANILLTIARSGLSQRGVARATGHAPSHVNDTVARFRSDGMDGLLERRGGNNRLARRDEIMALLPTLVAATPSDYGWSRSTWSVELVMLEVQRQLGVKVSRPHIGRMLGEARCRRVRPRPTIALTPKDHEEQVRPLKAELARVPDTDVVLYADEIDIHLNPKSGPDWTPPGVRKVLVTPGKNCKKYIAGAYNPDTGDLITTEGPSKSSDLFIALLSALVVAFPDAGTIHLVLDNYIIHKSKKTQAALAKLHGKIKVYFLPPYCPMHNPIERVWWDVHEHVTRNHRHPSIDDLMTAVRGYVQLYDDQGVHAASLSRAAA
jgi:transposase